MAIFSIEQLQVMNISMLTALDCMEIDRAIQQLTMYKKWTPARQQELSALHSLKAKKWAKVHELRRQVGLSD